VAALLASACSTPAGNPDGSVLTQPDSRCSPAACQLLTACGTRLPGVEDGTCDGVGVDAGFDVYDAGIASCIDACLAEYAGSFVACIGAHFDAAACADIQADGGQPDAVLVAACANSGQACAGPKCNLCSASCVSCQSQCSATQKTCDQTCLGAESSDAGACFACSGGCGAQFDQCYAGCMGM
jgi:hypothetical protein